MGDIGKTHYTAAGLGQKVPGVRDPIVSTTEGKINKLRKLGGAIQLTRLSNLILVSCGAALSINHSPQQIKANWAHKL